MTADVSTPRPCVRRARDAAIGGYKDGPQLAVHPHRTTTTRPGLCQITSRQPIHDQGGDGAQTPRANDEDGVLGRCERLEDAPALLAGPQQTALRTDPVPSW